MEFIKKNLITLFINLENLKNKKKKTNKIV